MRNWSCKWMMVWLGWVVLITASLHGTEDTTGSRTKKTGHLQGYILDADTKEGVGGVQILIREVHRSAFSHADGFFRIPMMLEGRYTLQTFRIGYREYRTWISVIAGDTLQITIPLQSMPIMGQVIVIESLKNNPAAAPVLELSGVKLRQNLGQTVAETVSNEPGMDQRTMGPAPARPVLRGLSGDRLLILEDKGRTGDLSATSADHAVTIDPISADKIEVIRGPAALIYGPNTLGGVINVERGIIPSFIPERWNGASSFQGETVNHGFVFGGYLRGKTGPIVLRGDASYRHSDDIRTPAGVLRNTPIQTLNLALGLSHIGNEGYWGGAGMWYQSNYGIPGGFAGAHPKGVRVELERKRIELKWDQHWDHPFFHHIEADYAFTNYFHRELESDGSVGTQFSVLSYHLNVKNHLPAKEHFKERTVGIWGEYRSYMPGGYIFTPHTRESTIAGFYFQRMHWTKIAWNASVRLDYRFVYPDEEKFSRIGHIRNRVFWIPSAATALDYFLNSEWTMSLRLMRSGRMPGIEELFSEGPHLAAYSFEVGNPDLKPESGIGSEFAVRYTSEPFFFDAAVFRNDMRRYLFPRNTGTMHIASNLPIYQYHSLHAVIEGAEATMKIQFTESTQLHSQVSYLRGYQKANRKPLPAMPPFTWKSEFNKTISNWKWFAIIRGASDQNRVDEFEAPTRGYIVFDAGFHRVYSRGKILHTLVGTVENITNTQYRRHLSRVRSIMPEPGRNIKLFYKIYF